MSGASLCSGAECPNCELHRRLLDEGAEPISGSVLREGKCRLDLRFHESRCHTRIKVDKPQANYRKTEDPGRQGKMCDYAAGTAWNEEFQCIAIELKGGAAEREEAIAQLQAGLDLLLRLTAQSVVTRPLAYLIVNKQAGPLKRILSKRQHRVRFGVRVLQIQVFKCGTRRDE